MDAPLTADCPKCGQSLPLTLRPETQHYGCIRCPDHGFIWIPKPAEDRKPRRRVNGDLAPLLPEGWRDFCWYCRRHREHLKQLRPAVVLQVHHILEVKDGGTDDPENLQMLCAECHAEVHRRREAFGRYSEAS